MMKTTDKPVKRPRHRVLKAIAWTIAAAVSAVAIVLCTIIWILTPARLTPLITDLANKSINGTLSLSKAELTVWKTFPHLYVELDSATLTSRAFDNLPPETKAVLPAYADTLLKADRIMAAINLPALLKGTISLYDAELTGVNINLVSVDSTANNFSILPADTTATEESATIMPDISLSRLRITDDMPVRYLSVADTLYICATLKPSGIHKKEDRYSLSLNSDMKALLPPDIDINSLTISLDGDIAWHHNTPEKLTFEGFDVTAGPLNAKLDSRIDLASPLTVETMALRINEVSPDEVIAILPESYKRPLAGFSSDMRASLTAELLHPYSITDTVMPSFKADVTIDPCRITYGRYHINSFEAKINALIDGKDPKASFISIPNLKASVAGASLAADGKITSLTANAGIDADLNLKIDIAKLPQPLKAYLKTSSASSGKIDFSSRLKMRLGDLKPNRFHRISLDGNLALKDIDLTMPQDDTSIYTKSTLLRLGSNKSLGTGLHHVDSLLTASVECDTLHLISRGFDIEIKDMKGGIGCANNSSSSDTTQINPIGALLKMGQFRYRATDSTRVRMRDASVRASLLRFEGQGRVPMLRLHTGCRYIFYADRLNRLLLGDGEISATARMRQLNDFPPRIRALYDSLKSAHPDATTDSIATMMRNRRKRGNFDLSRYDTMDFGVDGDTRKLLNRWNAEGAIKARRGFMFTPYFPIRNRIKDVDITFSTDSININNLFYQAGTSDLNIKGAVKNLRRALTSRAPVNIELSIESDTLNINELVQTSYRGAAFAEQLNDGSIALTDSENEETLKQLSDSLSATDSTAALLVPINVRLNATMKAHDVVYSDIAMHNFSGELLINDGAINLRDLSASSDIGRAALTALYTAPTKDDIHFGFGLKLNCMHIKQFINLMPAVDSLMPLLNDFDGVIDADIAATTAVDSCMNLILPSLEAAIKLSGKDLVLLDAETFRSLSKWLMFKDKKRNVIPSMEVEMLVDNSRLELFPFVFDFDRYRLAVMGSNDLALNYKYHISVLKSPLPFKFGLNLSGNMDNMKVRVGKAKYKPNQAGETIAIVDTTRVNLLKEIDRVFNRGARSARLGKLKIKQRPEKIQFDESSDTLSHNDSIMFMNEGVLPKTGTDE